MDGLPVTAFDRAIAPMSRRDLLSGVWGRALLRQTGDPGRFSALLPWDELNAILERHDLTPPRLDLFREGKSVDARRFLREGGGSQRLDAAGLVNSLSEGATLILHRVDELSAGVRELAEAFEDVLHSRTWVNLYASWRTQRGFDLHWDPQETMILQLSGRKHWKVYQPTRPHPLKTDVADAAPPTGEPLWEGVLNDGDMLHLPRGFWHVAIPLDEPSLHLTVTVKPAIGVDLLQGCIERLKEHDAVRANVPTFDDGEARAEYVSRLRQLVTESLTDDAVERFLFDWEAKIPLRPRVRLPHAARDAREPLTPEAQVRLAAVRRLSFEMEESGRACFRANAVRWRCSPELIPALGLLRGTESHSVRSLCDALPSRQAARELQMLLTALAMGGVVVAER